MSVYCQFYDNKQNKISEVIASNASISIPTNAVAGLFYDNTYKLDGLKLTLNNLTANDFSFDFAKDYFLYVFPSGYSSILATSVCSSSFMSGIPELSQNDKDYLKNLSDNSTIDFSTIVTALNSISSALSALSNLSNLTSLSNLADLANIITAIQNKDNQSDIVNSLVKIFTYTVQSSNRVRSIFTGVDLNTKVNSSYDNQNLSIQAKLTGLINSLSSYSFAYNGDLTNISANEKLLYRIQSCLSSSISRLSTLSEISSNSFLSCNNVILDNIETKLEQNLPFTTIVNNDYIDNCVSATVAYNKKIENIPFN